MYGLPLRRTWRLFTGILIPDLTTANGSLFLFFSSRTITCLEGFHNFSYLPLLTVLCIYLSESQSNSGYSTAEIASLWTFFITFFQLENIKFERTHKIKKIVLFYKWEFHWSITAFEFMMKYEFFGYRKKIYSKDFISKWKISSRSLFRR